MRSEEVGNGTTVAHHHILESPLVAQYLLKEFCAAAARLVVPTLIGAHHLPHLCLLHKVLECRHICLPKVTRRHIVDIGSVAAPLRSTVDGIVLGTGKEFAMLGSLGTLETTHHSLSHQRSEIRVFAVCLL